MGRAILLLLVLAWLGAACAPASSRTADVSQTPPARSSQTLVAAIGVEPKLLAARAIGQDLTVSVLLARRVFNADLALFNDQGNPLPYLADTLPQLNTDSWNVAPDGSMETTYRLRPNLVWHDGTPLTADDFVFSWKLYATPELGSAASLPINLIRTVEAPDDRTVVIQWTRPFPGAGSLQSIGTGVTGLPPLPRALLGPALESGSAQSLLNHPYWTNGFVGLGPYRLDRWEPGAYIEGAAFEQHALGAPKIQRIRLVVIPDGNTALANMLGGDVQIAADSTLTTSQLATLKQQRAERVSETRSANQYRAAHFQGRADFASPTALRDLRVRKALAHTVDRVVINERIRDGLYGVAHSMFPPTSELGRAVDEAVTKYPFDPRVSAQLMAEAGFSKGPDDFYIGPGGERFSAEARTNAGTENEAERSALASGWRQAGFDFQETVLSPTQAQDVQMRSTFPGIYTISAGLLDSSIQALASSNIPRAENNWRGSAYAGYANPEFDRVISAFTTALAQTDRIRAAVDIGKLYTSELPAIPLFFPTQVWAFTSDITGPFAEVSPESTPGWNVYEWQFR